MAEILYQKMNKMIGISMRDIDTQVVPTVTLLDRGNEITHLLVRSSHRIFCTLFWFCFQQQIYTKLQKISMSYNQSKYLMTIKLQWGERNKQSGARVTLGELHSGSINCDWIAGALLEAIIKAFATDTHKNLKLAEMGQPLSAALTGRIA